ncbi:molecular chaperone GroEL [Tardiphaga sp. vice304]|uniref:molecular chaperone GroEL n=1 Tax=unclassified Tardiphaga TaxID=2631404 RepID=UPI001163B3E7|nr:MULTISPECIES: molecular chaperone GroEL [unclassified Tardiphaga]QDM18826.1 molecular chaperone GroEL [Tardiphaga sp. vice278]QDM29043.1 molecular chaperone GroEL [Tardiphaga sp. vice304]
MAKMMLHDSQAREALARGVAKLAKAVSGTLGPKGMNAVMDRPIGTPIVSRDGVSIAAEIELECPFENMGAQVLREVSKQTNEVAGDGTTTATVLANYLVQDGLALLAAGANPVELVEGLELAVDETISALKRSAKSVDGAKGIRAIATIAANDVRLGAMVAEAFERAGNHGIVAVEFGSTVETTLEVVEGRAFERGYLSHHMVTDVERMQVVLDEPYILMTDHKILAIDELKGVFALIEKSGRPLLIIAEEVAPPVIMMLLSRREKNNFKVAAIHPPEYGHWRKAMLEDIAVATGGRVISKDLGGTVERASLEDLGSARQVRISSSKTLITAGHGKPKMVEARREQVSRQYEAAPENIERDKFLERLAKLSGGTAMILAGGATPVEQKRRAQLIEDSINATRAAIEEGVVPGGGVALIRVAAELDGLINRLEGSARQGAELVQRSLSQPLACIVANCGRGDSKAAVEKVAKASNGYGFDARTGTTVDMIKSGIIDPVKVSYCAMRNAGSVAALILTTQTLIAKRPDNYDPTSGPAIGGGAELL